MSDDKLKEILTFWAADKEGVSTLQISDVSLDYDEGWPGTDVTPGDPPTVKVRYTVTKNVVHEIPADGMGNFIVELANRQSTRTL